MISPITKLPDGSAFFVMDVDPNAPRPHSVHWNPGNKVVQDHRDGTIDFEATNRERALRGLPVPWRPAMAETETMQSDIL